MGILLQPKALKISEELDVNEPKGSNNGIYLRGIYEIQVQYIYGKQFDSHNNPVILL